MSAQADPTAGPAGTELSIPASNLAGPISDGAGHGRVTTIRTAASQPVDEPSRPTDRALDALYASVAAVYSDAGLRAPERSRYRAPKSAKPALSGHRSGDSWSDAHDAALSALVYPDADAPPAIAHQSAAPAPRAAILEHEAPAYPASVETVASLAAAANPTASDLALEVMSQRLTSLEEKLEVVLAHAELGTPADDILDRMDELKGQYQRVADEIGRLEVIEDNLARLIDEVAERQPDNGHLAESVANRVMREITEQGLGLAPSGYDVERLSDLEQLLSSYVSGRQTEGASTQQLLLAIRGLVESLNSRVGVIEHEIQQATTLEVAPAYDAHPAGPHAIELTGEADSYAIDDVDAGDRRARSDDEYGDDSHTSEAELQLAPAARSTRRPIPNVPTPQLEPHPASTREQMIASARRAAQAAATGGSTASNPMRPSMPQAAPGKGQARSAVSNRASRFSLDKRSPRPVIILTMLALVLAGAGLLYGKMTRKPAGPKITIERTTTPEGSTQEKAAGEGKQSLNDEMLPDTSFELETGSTPGDDLLKSGPLPLSPTRASVDTASVTDSAEIIGSVSEDLPPEGIAPLATRIKAANGEPVAQFEIASSFARGVLGQPDMALAAKWYERAAIAGHAPSQYQLAALLERGTGVPQDATRARQWYGRAAAAGNVKAMHNLAVLLTTDDGGPRNYATAAKLFARAAGYGLADSQFNLAILHENGLGVKRSTGEAYRWFALASEAGDKDAVRRREAVKRRLSPPIIEQLDAEIKAWSPAPIDEAANSLPQVQAAVAPEASEASPVAVQTKASDILLVQDMLKSLGYTVGKPGVLDSRTSKAILSFEQRSKMPPTGDVSDALIARLTSLAG